MRRTVVVVVLGSLLAVVPLLGASAGPTREFLPLPDRIVLDDVCPTFSIVADILANKEYATTFTDANGDPVRSLTTGTLKVRLTNPENDASVVLNISGPGTTTYHADGSSTLVARGTWFFFFFPGQLAPGSEGSSILHTGTLTLLTNADGTQEIVSERGRTEDLCARLS